MMLNRGNSKIVSSLAGAVLALFFAGGFAACGGNGGGGNGNGGSSGFTYSLDSSQKVSAMSDSQLSTMCEEQNGYTADQISTDEICLYTAHFTIAATGKPSSDSKAQMQCSNSKKSCKDNSDSGNGGGGCNWDGAGKCDAKLSLLEKCHTDYIAELKSTISDLPACGDVSASWYEGKGAEWFTPSPEKCQEWNEKCPALYGNLVGG